MLLHRRPQIRKRGTSLGWKFPCRSFSNKKKRKKKLGGKEKSQKLKDLGALPVPSIDRHLLQVPNGRGGRWATMARVPECWGVNRFSIEFQRLGASIRHYPRNTHRERGSKLDESWYVYSINITVGIQSSHANQSVLYFHFFKIKTTSDIQLSRSWITLHFQLLILTLKSDIFERRRLL